MFETLVARVRERLAELATDPAKVRQLMGTPLDAYATRLPPRAA